MFLTLQTVAPYNENIAIGLIMGVGVIATVACLLLPVETKGRALRVSIHRASHDQLVHYTYLFTGLWGMNKMIYVFCIFCIKCVYYL